LEELCADVKEPEEADHRAKCHLLHNGETTTNETVLETSDEWMNVLGHDRLKKRVSLYVIKIAWVAWLGHQTCNNAITCSVLVMSLPSNSFRQIVQICRSGLMTLYLWSQVLHQKPWVKILSVLIASCV